MTDRAPLQILAAIPPEHDRPGSGMVQFRTNGIRDAVCDETALTDDLQPLIKRFGSAYAPGSNSIDEADLRALLRAIKEAK